MGHSMSTDHAPQTTPSLRPHPHPPFPAAPEPGDRFLGPSGKIWTVQRLTARGNRIELTTPTAQGDAGAIVDALAIAGMIPLPTAASSSDITIATPGDLPTERAQTDTTDDGLRTRAVAHTAADIAHDASTRRAIRAG